jgi:hypothetical protein
MSNSKQVIVFRDYRPAPEDCVCALAFLLRASVSKKAAAGAASNDAKVRSKSDSRAMGSIP